MPRALPPPLDFSREGPLGTRLRRLFHAEDHAGFQALMRQAIRRLDEVDEPSPQHLAFLLRFSERACLEPALLEDLLNRLLDRAQSMPELLPIWQAVRQRQDFRTRLQAQRRGPLTLVSLGLHCLPWTLVNRWGFREASQFEALQNPFCLAMHKAGTVTEAIAGDFATYAEPEAMREATTPQGQRIAMRRDGGAVWNHHRGPAWIDDSYAGLRQSLAQRAEAFRASCRAEGLVFLMGDCRIDRPEGPIPFLAPLRAALARATGNPRDRLILSSQPRRGGAAGLHWLDAETALLSAPYPHPHYVWANDDTADSAEGLAFEQAYATALLTCLARWDLAAA